MKRKMIVMCLVILASCFLVAQHLTAQVTGCSDCDGRFVNESGDTIRKLTVKRNLKVKKDLTVDGNVTAGTFTGDGSALTNLQSGIPSGVIVIWSGNIASIPAGWAFCDGSNGTPNLTARFIYGAWSEASIGFTGGQSFVTLFPGQMPRHTHGVSDPGHDHFIDLDDGNAGGGVDDASESAEGSTRTGGNTTGISIGFTGSGQSHENKPPYYILAFIMKL